MRRGGGGGAGGGAGGSRCRGGSGGDGGGGGGSGGGWCRWKPLGEELGVVVAADDSDGYETMVLGAGAGTLCVVDVYNSWCGPCEALSRKIGTLFNELGEFDIKFVQAKADAIKALAEFAVPARSKPLFLFIKGGKEVARMDGANPIELEKLVTANATKRQ